MFNGLDYYGSYLGIQQVFKSEITDDLEYLYSCPDFMETIGKGFQIGGSQNRNYDDFSNIGGSRANKHKIYIGEDASIEGLGIESIEPSVSESVVAEPESAVEEEIVYEKDKNSKSSTKSSTYSSSSLDSKDLNYSSGEDDSDEKYDPEDDSENESNSESEEDEGESSVFVYINNFPMQMICLEKCQGTLDQLFVDEEIDEDNGAAYLMQIIMTLITYQKAFHFTHNDLHTNNIMYIETDQEYVYYKYSGKFYRVPTYGKIFKIIDYGRAIYRFQGKTFCSDSFAPGGDAHTQYNCEPFMNEKKARIDPNPSFDLCRLGCSIYDFIIESESEPRDAFQETIWRWCQDDNGKNILYKKNGEERYPNFKLYKMIARNVHNHTPHAQLEMPIFDQFRMNAKKAAKLDKDLVRMWGTDIDSIPEYVI